MVLSKTWSGREKRRRMHPTASREKCKLNLTVDRAIEKSSCPKQINYRCVFAADSKRVSLYASERRLLATNYRHSASSVVQPRFGLAVETVQFFSLASSQLKNRTGFHSRM